MTLVKARHWSQAKHRPRSNTTPGALGLNEIHNTDALSLLRSIPDASVDLVIADPPYNTSKAGGRNGFKGKTFINNDWDAFESQEDYRAFCKYWMRECRRILKDNGTMYVWGYARSLPYLPIDDWYQLNLIVWHKQNAFPTTMHDSMWSPSCELAYFLRKDSGRDHTFNISKSDFARDIFIHPVVNDPCHPTVKPISIISEMIRRSSNEGDLVVDPFAGSGTTAIAARNLKRSFICGDLNPAYVDLARQRLAQPYTPSMFLEAWGA